VSRCIVVMQDINTQTILDATQKETAIDQQQHSCETLICQRHQTILRFLSTAATASTRLRVRELYCLTSYDNALHVLAYKTIIRQDTLQTLWPLVRK
jgi:hypothetical protein